MLLRTLIAAVFLCATLSVAQTREAVHTHRNQARNEAASQIIALTGGKLLTITHGTIENGVLVMEGGKITAVGKSGEVKIPAGSAGDRCYRDDCLSGTDRLGDASRSHRN